MNKARRKELESIVSIIESAAESLEYTISDEEDAYDRLPESLQESQRGDEMEENISDLNDALSSLEEAVEIINDVISK